MSGKGGVGKSFVAANIAYGLASQGKKVGLLDADIHGPSIAKLTGIEDKTINKHSLNGMPTPIKVLSNLSVLTVASLLESDSDALIWRGPLKMVLIKQFFSDFYWDDLDYLIIDCPPGTGDEPLSVKQVLDRIDGAVIVTTPQDMALLDVKKSINFTHRIEVPILGIIENMKHVRCPECNHIIAVFPGDNLKNIIKQHAIELLAELEIDPFISSADDGKPYISHFAERASASELMKAVSRIRYLVEEEQVQVQ